MAVLGLKNSFVFYRNGDNYVASRVSPLVEQLVDIKEFDNGYFVLDIKHHTQGLIEDYLDLRESLVQLGLSSKCRDYFKSVKKEDICLQNP